MPEPEPFALKDMFDAARFRRISRDVAAVYPRFDRKRFLALGLADLDALNLLQRLRRVTDALHQTLPADFPKALAILRNLAERTERGFVSLFLPDYVGVHGRNHFDLSLEALKCFTPLGSSEFGIRPFLRDDLARVLRTMEEWTRDANDHVRRLASEGCRPRLPWSFRLDALIEDPSPAAGILHQLRRDPSLYVRKSVANHLNDITKDHPGWVLETIGGWDLDDPHSAWIARRALRTLIKNGDRRALAVIGAGEPARVEVDTFRITPARIRLGDRISLELVFRSTSRKPQKLVVDYTIHYVKKSGAASGKVFKWKEVLAPGGGEVTLTKSQVIRDFSTRRHHPGRHAVEVKINGAVSAQAEFLLAGS